MKKPLYYNVYRGFSKGWLYQVLIRNTPVVCTLGPRVA